jgi:peptidoglycan/LPS O-acetylase OafA/YrhL
MDVRASTEQSDATSRRNHALDAIRCLAALSVAFGHPYFGATGLAIWTTRLSDFPAMPARDITYRLLSVVFASDAAVMVFFVQSGHVLWQSFVRRRLDWQGLPDYILSRIWRLYPLIISITLMMLVFLPAGIIETLANMVLLLTNMIGVTWSLQVELVGSLAIALMWLLGRHSLAKMPVALAIAIAVVPLARGTVLVFMLAFAFGGLIGAVPARVWSSRVPLWIGLTALLAANLFFGHGGVARCLEIVGATAVVGCIGARPFGFLQSAGVQFRGGPPLSRATSSRSAATIR